MKMFKDGKMSVKEVQEEVMFVLGGLFCVLVGFFFFWFSLFDLVINNIILQVIDVLFYHEDLIEDFLRFFTKNPVSTASLLLQL